MISRNFRFGISLALTLLSAGCAKQTPDSPPSSESASTSDKKANEQSAKTAQEASLSQEVSSSKKSELQLKLDAEKILRSHPEHLRNAIRPELKQRFKTKHSLHELHAKIANATKRIQQTQSANTQP